MPCGGLAFAPIAGAREETVGISVYPLKSSHSGELRYRLRILQYPVFDRNLGEPVRLKWADGVVSRLDPRHEEQVAEAAALTPVNAGIDWCPRW